MCDKVEIFKEDKMEIFRVASTAQIDISASQMNDSQKVREIAKQTDQVSVAKNEEQKNSIEKDLDKVTKKLNDQMESLKTNIRFAYNDKIDSMYVNVLEQDSGKLIRKVPSDEMMKLTEHFREIIGLIFDKNG